MSSIMMGTNSLLMKNTYVFFIGHCSLNHIDNYHDKSNNTIEDMCHDLNYIITHSNLNKIHIFIKDDICVINEDLLKKCNTIAYFIYQFTGKKTILHINKTKTTFLKKMYLENKNLADYDAIQIQIDKSYVEFKDGDVQIRITNTSKGSVVNFSFENNL